MSERKLQDSGTGLLEQFRTDPHLTQVAAMQRNPLTNRTLGAQNLAKVIMRRPRVDAKLPITQMITVRQRQLLRLTADTPKSVAASANLGRHGNQLLQRPTQVVDNLPNPAIQLAVRHGDHDRTPERRKASTQGPSVSTTATRGMGTVRACTNHATRTPDGSARGIDGSNRSD